MKQTKKMTRSQRILIAKAGFDTQALKIRIIEDNPKYIKFLVDDEDQNVFKIPKED